MLSSAQTLNTVLIRIYRSLLQYAGESWPWSMANSGQTRGEIQKMADEERRLAARIFAWLDANGLPVDLGAYPDNSALHYVSLGYMLKRIAADHAGLAQALRQTLAGLSQGSEPARLVEEVLGAVERHLVRVRELSADVASSHAA